MKFYSQDRNFGCRISTNFKYRGNSIAIIENELLRISILLDKGADIFEFLYKPIDVDFMWRSPLGVRGFSSLSAAPTDENHSWIDYYPGGWQEILPNGGEKSNLNGASLGLHAEVSNQPWDYEISKDEMKEVCLTTYVRTTRSPLYLEKKFSLKSGIPILFIEETLINECAQVIPIMWGHHIAFGEPFLNESCRIECGAKKIIGQENINQNNRLKPREESRWPYYRDNNDKLIDLSIVPPPYLGVEDISYLTDFSSGWYTISDPKRGIGFGLVWPEDIYPYLWFYQNYNSKAGYPWFGRAYTIGLEPFSSYPNKGIQSAIDNNTAIFLQPFEEKKVWLRALIFFPSKEVEEITKDGIIIEK